MAPGYSSVEGQRRFVAALRTWQTLLAIAFIWPSAGALAGESDVAMAQEQELILQWRQSRDENLRQEHGWLTLVGFDWLSQGENRIGSAPDNDIRLPGGPEHWGTIVLTDNTLLFNRAGDAAVTVDGVVAEQVELVADNVGEPTTVESGTITFHVIYRESYALRVSDSQAATRINFAGVASYEIQPTWRIEGRLIPAEKGQTIDIGNVLGQVSPTPVLGTFEFEREGKAYQLVGLGDESSSSVWFIFADRTSGHGTYGAGRFLYSEGLPQEGELVVDFNKAYNPPCAFNDYSTCPLPPQANRLDLAVTAGEKDVHQPADGT